MRQLVSAKSCKTDKEPSGYRHHKQKINSTSNNSTLTIMPNIGLLLVDGRSDAMNQRVSGYAREAFDKYQTPAWATHALVPHIPADVRMIWEPAAGDGFMVRALQQKGYDVGGTDIAFNQDFLGEEVFYPAAFDAIITNPPYDQATEFAQAALGFFSPRYRCRFVAMLLRIDFDSAKTRRHLFAENSYWSKKLVLLDRIRWEGIEQHTASPSYNHCWMIWGRNHKGPPTIAYAQREKIKKHFPLLEIVS